MNTAPSAGTATSQLLAWLDADNPYDYAPADILPLQLQAAQERFQTRVEQIKLLRNRAETGGVSAIQKTSDIVPLLFAHTAYKSYPEGWLAEQKWDRMARWLDTVSTHRVAPIENADGIDDWLTKLEQQGHYVSCSSGTSGKCAMMNSAMFDLEFSGRNLLKGLEWSGVAANRDRKLISMGQVVSSARNRTTAVPMMQALCAPGVMPFAPKVSPITIGGMLDMVILNRKIADGVAKPNELAHYAAESERRAKEMDTITDQIADALIEHRGEKLHIMGMFAPIYRAAELIRARGYSAKDFQDNTAFVAGGLKGAQLPSNYREFICETLNLPMERIVQAYGMQEMNTNAFRCKCGRYHLPPWMMLLLLDETGETLIEQTSGEHEGRAAFLDLSLEGRWGGVISGDKIRVSYDPCACGARSPSIHPDIQRFADLGGDKIACAGTIDAYVRGVA